MVAATATPPPELPDLLSARPRRNIEAWLVSQQLTLEQLRSTARSPELVEARAIVIRYLRRHGWSSPMIGRFIARDHSTVLHSLKRPIPGGGQ